MNSETESESTPAVVKFTPVKIIRKDRQVILVEWLEDDQYYRGIIPRQELKDRHLVSQTVLEASAPYGVDLSHFEMELDHEKFVNELRRQGGYTADEIKNLPPNAFLIAINNALGGIKKQVRIYLASNQQEG